MGQMPHHSMVLKDALAASLQPGKELLKLARDAKSDATEEEVKGLRKELLKEI